MNRMKKIKDWFSENTDVVFKAICICFVLAFVGCAIFYAAGFRIVRAEKLEQKKMTKEIVAEYSEAASGVSDKEIQSEQYSGDLYASVTDEYTVEYVGYMQPIIFTGSFDEEAGELVQLLLVVEQEDGTQNTKKASVRIHSLEELLECAKHPWEPYKVYGDHTMYKSDNRYIDGVLACRYRLGERLSVE